MGLSERAGTRVRGVYKWNLSEKSKKANAALTGLGNTRRIILADTLLEQLLRRTRSKRCWPTNWDITFTGIF